MNTGPERYLAVASRLGTRLVEDAVWHEDRCTWLGDDIEPTAEGWKVVHRSCGPDLYGGTSGIALFLAYLWKATGEDSLRRAAEGAMRHALRASGGEPSAGLYQGTAGIAWTAVVLGKLLGIDQLARAGGALAERLASSSEAWRHDKGADLIVGRSGTLAALLALAAELERADLLESCRQLGDSLLADAHRSAFGWSWGSTDPVQSGPDLCGLAHGASGVALALLNLAVATGEVGYRIAAEEAARYERGWFNRRHCGWPDLRGPQSDECSEVQGLGGLPPPAYWCHGAVGIGLGRLHAHELTGDTAALADAGASIQAARVAASHAMSVSFTGPAPFEANFSQCHGLAGPAELFLLAYEVTAHGEHLDAARRIGDRGAAAEATNGAWPCGVEGGGETPGLMLGLAGIGACYLRLFDPRSMPLVGLLSLRPGTAG